MIRRQVVMPVTPERLWAALTDPDEMVGWFGARVEWQLEPGSPARFRGDDGSDRAGRVEVVRPGRHLRFRWWPAEPRPTSPGGADADSEAAASEAEAVSGAAAASEPAPVSEAAAVSEAAPVSGAAAASEAAGPGEVTEVSYVLEPVPGGTRLTVQERQVESSAAGFARARSGGSHPGWTAWDGRLVMAWAGLATPALEGVRA